MNIIKKHLKVCAFFKSAVFVCLILLLYGSNLMADVNPSPSWSVQARCFQDGPSGSFDDIAVKDPSIVYSDGMYHLFYTSRNSSAWGLGYASATSISGLNSASHTRLTSIGTGGGLAAPQIFWFGNKGKWFLIYQNGTTPSYSTNTDVGDPTGWTAVRNMDFSDGGIDYWCIVEGSNVYIFYAANDGSHTAKRRSTTISNFPNGWSGATTIATDVFEGMCIYKNNADGMYYMVIEDMGATRWQELWTASGPGGSWSRVSEQWAHPNDVIYEADHWTDQVSHCEIIRAGTNELLEVNDLNNCTMIFQGVVDGNYGNYASIPYDIGTATNGGGTTTTTTASTSTTTSGCDPTTITPYIRVNDGYWQQTSSVTVNSGDKVKLGPQPTSGGSWSWSGCGTSGSSREQTIYPTGSCTATATYTNDCGAQSYQDFNITVSGGGDNEVWLEAECGSVGSLWNINSDGNASNDQYVTIQSGNNSTGSAPGSSSGHITYDFSLSSSGSYTLWARVITPNGNDDSFWIRVNGGSWYQWNNIGPNSNWTWEQCQSYDLSSGNNTLTVAYREDGAQLDKLYIGNSTPSGEGSAANNCSGTTTTTTAATTTTTTTTTGATTSTTTASTTSTTSSGGGCTCPSLCGSSTTITLSFTQNGAGEYCWVTSDNISYVNSWALEELNINGQDYTNQWANSFPDKINGNYYIYYRGNYGWSHFEATAGAAKRSAETMETRTVPTEFALDQNFPNPFNPETNISYQLPEAGDVRLVIFDLQGHTVKTLIRGRQDAGYYTMTWNSLDEFGKRVPSGMYLYRLRVRTTSKIFDKSMKMVLLK